MQPKNSLTGFFFDGKSAMVWSLYIEMWIIESLVNISGKNWKYNGFNYDILLEYVSVTSIQSNEQQIIIMSTILTYSSINVLRPLPSTAAKASQTSVNICVWDVIGTNDGFFYWSNKPHLSPLIYYAAQLPPILQFMEDSRIQIMFPNGLGT